MFRVQIMRLQSAHMLDLPDRFDALTRVCFGCGDTDARGYLGHEGRCVGRRQRGIRDPTDAAPTRVDEAVWHSEQERDTT